MIDGRDRTIGRPAWRRRAVAALALAAADMVTAAFPVAAREHRGLGDAVVVSWFGERPAYSPDGKRIALVGKTYGDADEIELATGKVRNLTAHLPHQGIMRIQYRLADPGLGYWSGVYGVDVAGGQLTPYRTEESEYNEMEGIAPDGRWAAVECAKRSRSGVPAIDICRLELTRGGALTPLVTVTMPGSTRKVNNPVVSPDGRSMAFSTADTRYDAGSGDGIMVVDLGK